MVTHSREVAQQFGRVERLEEINRVIAVQSEMLATPVGLGNGEDMGDI